MNNSTVKPAEMLTGLNLDNGWKVSQLISMTGQQTGSNFSCSYVVEKISGEKAFLKAMDYSKALENSDPASALQPIVNEHLFERKLVELCKEKKLSKVIRLIEWNNIQLDPKDLLSNVQYVIFELGEGDIRRYIKNWDVVDDAWKFCLLHNVAVGLKQLHYIKIAHQDIKPSNIVVIDNRTSKICDFGRSSLKGYIGPHDEKIFPGDPGYAPIEKLYHYETPDWEKRRLSSDLYMLGGLICFIFVQQPINSLLVTKLDKQYHPSVWGGTYEDVLPYLKEAYSNLIIDLKDYFELNYEEYSVDLLTAISQLCEPDVSFRGHPKDRSIGEGQRYSVERYSNIFDRLAKKAEYKIKIAK
ncbi:MAG: protein kinase family protein [Gammaproteobacteria bacterium]|nr:protein kinase family protein [Gammaproteobacteria bacterium]